RGDGQPLGTFEQVQAMIRDLFPSAQFGWTLSGPERVRISQERGQPLPAELRQRLESLPSIFEGVAEGEGYRVTFGLGDDEGVACLRVTPLGSAQELQSGLAALESAAGASFELSEEKRNGS